MQALWVIVSRLIGRDEGGKIPAQQRRHQPFERSKRGVLAAVGAIAGVDIADRGDPIASPLPSQMAGRRRFFLPLANTRSYALGR